MMTRSQLICGDAQQVLVTLPSRLPNTTSSTFSLVGGQFPATDQPLTSHSLRAIDDRPAACELYEPRRFDFPFAGIFVGTLASNRRRVHREALILLGLQAMAEDLADVKGDFHDAQIRARQNANHLNSILYKNAKKSRRHSKTMAMFLNHTVCGGTCGEERRMLWPA
jgi:hypothetical protein